MYTTDQMVITAATPAMLGSVQSFLRLANLPADDLLPTLPHCFVVTDSDQVIATIGLEVYGDVGLLRSMATHPAHRGRGLASALVTHLQQYAASLGLQHLYLLTETAAGFFAQRGYQQVQRSTVPPALQASSEFSHVCPASATIMKKEITP